MSKWTHPMCASCWKKWNPDREPIALRTDVETERCCWCGRDTTSGIFVRQDPFATPKHRVGDHDDD